LTLANTGSTLNTLGLATGAGGDSVVFTRLADTTTDSLTILNTDGATLTGATAVTAITNIIPTISRNADTLISSVATGNQWQLNGFDIQGEKGQKLKVTQSGKYRTSIVDGFNCESLSAEQDVTVTSVINVAPEKISFTVAPNPNNGNFNLSFNVTGRENLGIAVINAEGREVYRQTQANFSGNFKGNIRLNNPKAGIYLVKITHGLNQYMKRIVIL
jgi:hypothetical protein